MSNITTTYKDHDIRYEETTNKWVIYAPEASGSQRVSEQLGLEAAKKSIDRRLRVAKSFNRHQAILVDWGTPRTVTVTSYAKDRSQVLEAWIVNAKGERSRVRLDTLREFNPKSGELLVKLNNLTEAKKRVDREYEDIKKQLPDYVKIDTDEDEDNS